MGRVSQGRSTQDTAGGPLVSVVTPFYNTADFLAECIESVLAQSYTNFEYLLSDNGSTDGSLQIAQDYAQRDSRIRLIRQPVHLSQVAHYNSALREISHDSKYCKMVQADDRVFPGCLDAMVSVFEQSQTIGLVSSCDLKGDRVRGADYPFQLAFTDGKEMARFFLLKGVYVFGSPSTVMYRSNLVREAPGFFKDGLLHEDTEKCMEILMHWDFGFVRQVLSFSRDDNNSISTSVASFKPQSLDRYIIVRRFARSFLEPNEASALIKETKRMYYSVLAEEALRPRAQRFWRYHADGLRTIDESLDNTYLMWMISRKLLWMLINPGLALKFLWGLSKRARNAVRMMAVRFIGTVL